MPSIIDFLKTPLGQMVVTGALGWLWAHRWWRSKLDKRAERLGELAIYWFDAVSKKGDAEKWDNPRRWREFLKGLSAELAHEGFRALSPDEIGALGQKTQRLHWGMMGVDR